MCKPREIAKKLIQRAAIIESFASTFPELVCEWDSSNSISPSDVAPHSNQRVMWVCSECGNKWTTTVNNRAAGYGCRECYLRNRTIENKKSVVCVETCEVFESIAVASQKMSISRTGISNCLSGRSKSAGGYHWKYGEEDPS